MIQIKPVETDDELTRARELLARVHFENPSEGLRWLQTCGVHYPGYLKEHTRLAVQDGQIVGGLRLLTDTIRIGEARLKMGGIGWVTTEPEHRRRGICRRLMEDVMGYMDRHRYHVAMLFGIPDLYHRWGFVTSLADYAISMDTDEAKTFENPFQVRSLRPSDIPAVQHLHNAGEANVACSIVRVEGHLASQWEHCKGYKILSDAEGRVLAYFESSDGEGFLKIGEVGASEFGLWAGLVGACGRLASEGAHKSIEFSCPPGHPLARYLLQFRTRHEMRIDRDASGMMAFIRLDDCLEHMIPEWESLLARSIVRDYRTEITLVVEGKSSRVRLNRGAIDVSAAAGQNKVSLSKGELMHLLTGYRYARDVIANKRCLLSPEAREFFLAIFPKRDTFVWPFDRF